MTRRKDDAAVIAAACVTGGLWMLAVVFFSVGSLAGGIVSAILFIVAAFATASTRLLYRDWRLQSRLRGGRGDQS